MNMHQVSTFETVADLMRNAVQRLAIARHYGKDSHFETIIEVVVSWFFPEGDDLKTHVCGSTNERLREIERIALPTADVRLI
jgi:hypothetical protein